MLISALLKQSVGLLYIQDYHKCKMKKREGSKVLYKDPSVAFLYLCLAPYTSGPIDFLLCEASRIGV